MERGHLALCTLNDTTYKGNRFAVSVTVLVYYVERLAIALYSYNEL